MKVVLAGAGFIGQEVITQLLKQDIVTSIIVLSRRERPDVEARDKRTEVLVLHEFNSYPPSVMQKLAGARACIWTLGGSNSTPTPADKCIEVEAEYPVTAANAFLAAAKTDIKAGEKIRFLFVSGILSVSDQSRSLWFLQEGRKARGLAESKLDEIAAEHADLFESVIIQAGKVLGKSTAYPDLLVGVSRLAIRVDHLAAAMVETALHGTGSQLISNTGLRRIGKDVLQN